MDVTVIVATYGDTVWQRRARRAIASVPPHIPVIAVHGLALHDARNIGLQQVQTEYVCHLDADDTLASGYFDALAEVDADIRVPAVSYVRGGRARPAAMPRVVGHHHDCTADCIMSGEGNWIVIGAVARTQLLRDAGGWRAWECYEDYDLWMRACLHGATVAAAPDAVYLAQFRSDSRNRAPQRAVKHATHQAINTVNLGEPVIA